MLTHKYHVDFKMASVSCWLEEASVVPEKVIEWLIVLHRTLNLKVAVFTKIHWQEVT